MNKLFFDTVDFLMPRLQRGEIDWCENHVAERLKNLEKTPFHIVIELLITNDPKTAAKYFDRFIEKESQRFAIRATYTEMNGFDINPDRWYCDPFAYSFDGGHETDEWLADFESNQFEELEINGLEALQEVYANDFLGNHDYEDSIGLSGILVVLKFQRFIQNVVSYMNRLEFPLYVSAHDYELIARLMPKLNS